LTGRANVSVYFTRYGEIARWRVATCLAEGRPALVMNDPTAEAKTYLIVIDWAGDRVARIRDFRFAPYVMDDLTVSPL
jgi:RNA polymerase sigma-70 factor (ECF subfamily)